MAVLNYNGAHLLRETLPSIVAQSHTPAEIVVLENGSTDSSVEYLRSEWPDIRVVALPENVGVAAALNRCVEAAGTEFVALLNNDVELDRECIAQLVLALVAHPQAASASPKLVDYARRDMLDGAGDVMDWSGVCTRRGHGEVDRGQYEEPGEAFSACGGAALYRRQVFDVLGLFDEDFFAYFEDVDWGFRAQLAGYSCRYVPSAVAYHMGSATLGPVSDFTRMQMLRNGIWLVAKNYPFSALVLHSPRLLFVQLRNFAGSVVRGRPLLFLRAWRDALRKMPAVLRKRREIQRMRVVGMDRLSHVMSVG